jgi:hypothetical protein
MDIRLNITIYSDTQVNNGYSNISLLLWCRVDRSLEREASSLFEWDALESGDRFMQSHYVTSQKTVHVVHDFTSPSRQPRISHSNSTPLPICTAHSAPVSERMKAVCFIWTLLWDLLLVWAWEELRTDMARSSWPVVATAVLQWGIARQCNEDLVMK